MTLDLLIPARCAGCGALGHPCCRACSQVWGSLTEVVRSPATGLTPVYALARYSGVAKRLLIAYKERGRRDLAAPLGDALASALVALPGRLSCGGSPDPAGPPRGPGALLPGAGSRGDPCSGEPGGRPAELRGSGADLSRADLSDGGLPGLDASGAADHRGSPGGFQAFAGRPARQGRLPDRPPPDGFPVTQFFTGPRPWCLVPAPSRRSAARLRGGPHVRRLADSAARRLAAGGAEAVVAPALAVKGVRDAVGLTREQRVANLAGRLRFVPAGRPPSGTSVVVLDDVITTGATAAACVRALAGAGVAVTAVLALLVAG